MQKHGVITLICLMISGAAAYGQSLMNSFTTIAMQRCLAAIETSNSPRYRTLFPGEPAAGRLPEDIFAPIGYWLTSDGRVYLAVDANGNCTVGDTKAAEDRQAHLNAIRKFNAWTAEEVKAGRYLDTQIPEPDLDYRRTFVSTGWSAVPILVTLISDQEAGILALVAEKSAVVTTEPELGPDEAPSNLLNKPEVVEEVTTENSL